MKHKTTVYTTSHSATVCCIRWWCRQTETIPFVNLADAGIAEALAAYAGKSHETRPRRFRLGVDARRPNMWPLGAGTGIAAAGGLTDIEWLIVAGVAVIAGFSIYWAWQVIRLSRQS